MYLRIIFIFLVCLVPIATLVLAAIYHFSPEYHTPSFFNTFPPLLTAFAGLAAIYSLILLTLLVIFNLKNKEITNKINSLEESNADLIKQNHVFQSKIDLLSATREIPSAAITLRVWFLIGPEMPMVPSTASPFSIQ